MNNKVCKILIIYIFFIQYSNWFYFSIEVLDNLVFVHKFVYIDFSNKVYKKTIYFQATKRQPSFQENHCY
jgi:hypothetical protein